MGSAPSLSVSCDAQNILYQTLTVDENYINLNRDFR